MDSANKNRLYQRAYYAANKEKVNARIALYAKLNREKVRAIAKRSRVKNKEKIKLRRREWSAKNVSKIKGYLDKYRSSHREEINQKAKERASRLTTHEKMKWQNNNPQRMREIKAKHRALHPEKGNAYKAQRRAAKFKATPKWANSFFIEEAYRLAKLRTKIMGFPWHVDHIVPLKSPLVCGLHVHNNLQVIPAVRNLSKNNRYWPDKAGG